MYATGLALYKANKHHKPTNGDALMVFAMLLIITLAYISIRMNVVYINKVLEPFVMLAWIPFAFGPLGFLPKNYDPFKGDKVTFTKMQKLKIWILFGIGLVTQMVFIANVKLATYTITKDVTVSKIYDCAVDNDCGKHSSNQVHLNNGTKYEFNTREEFEKYKLGQIVKEDYYDGFFGIDFKRLSLK